MKGIPSLGPWPRTQVILATDIWLGLMVDLVPSLRNSASSYTEELIRKLEKFMPPNIPQSSFPTLYTFGLAYLIKGDKLSIQAHQVPNLWHLIQHQWNEGGMCFPLLPCQWGFSHQDTCLNRVLDWKGESRRHIAGDREVTRAGKPREALQRLGLQCDPSKIKAYK